MATQKITNISSGIYTREIDLTVQAQAAGTFAGGAIGTMAKGPAFEVITSASFDERLSKLGGLNPKFPSSYFARAFLSQANNYKEIRLLGLEGYTDDPGLDAGATGKSFVVMYDIPSVPPTAATLTSPVIATAQSIAAVLKPRRTTFTGLSVVTSVVVSPVPAAVTPTDEKFLITINFANLSTMVVTGSLRPGSKDYISKVFGTDPLDGTLIQNKVSPLFVEFVVPSITGRPSTDSLDGIPAGENSLDTNHPLAYYYPGDENSQTVLNLTAGDMTIDLSFQYPGFAVSAASNTSPINVTTAANTFITGQKVTINSVVGNTATNGTFFVNVLSATNFELFTDSGLTIPVAGNGTYVSGGTARLAYTATWEREVMDFANIPFQTPITPWFVSDFDSDGEVKRLFRVWSISDGESANTEIKIELSNFDPAAYGGKGSFDMFVRLFNDSEDFGTSIVEGFRGLTLDPKNDNYILRRVGDGEIFPVRSRFIFLEFNLDEPLPNNALPYGSEGYPNIAGISMQDVIWATEYDRNKSISKQALGLPANNINMFHAVAPDQLAFKNVQTSAGATGKGFHLNPQSLDPLTGLGATVSVNFDLANPRVYLDKTNIAVVPGEKARRSRYVVCMFGGFDGWNAYEERKWGDVTSKDYEALTIAVEVLNDPESLEADFSVLVTPDLNIVDHAAATSLVLEMCESREDALYVYDFAYDPEANPSQAKDIIRVGNMKSNFGAIYFPHVQISDEVNKINIFLPPSLIALQTIASVATNEEVWQPPAGSLRTITSDLVRTRRRMRINDREILKSVNINPITLFPGSGFEITESRTQQEVFSALSFIHNRLLLGFAKKAIRQTLRPLLHQLQNDSLRRAFENLVRPIFARIQKLNGIETFEVTVLNVDEDKTTLHGQITIVPLYPVEKIIVDFVLKDSAVTFAQ